MNKDISVLMDGELPEDESEMLLDRIDRAEEGRKDWEMYHLIGDVLRQPDHIHCDLSEKVRARMEDEPIIYAPRMQAVNRKFRAIALSAAASLTAVGIVLWMSQQIGSEDLQQMAMRQSLSQPANMQIQSKSSDYLLAHQEFSPSTDMNGGASYMRMVTYDSEGR